MTNQELIAQLKTLRNNIYPDKEWADLTRTQLCGLKPGIVESIFAFVVPKQLAIPAMAVVVAVLGSVSAYSARTIDSEVGGSSALTASLKHVSDETAREIIEIQELATSEVNTQILRISAKKSSKWNAQVGKAGAEDYSDSYTVVFNKDAEERENFQALLRERIETKIDYVRDLFEQVDNGELVREITQNQRRYEENFKFFGEGRDEQVKILLEDAEKALEEGDLITALDLVNAIEKLIKD